MASEYDVVVVGAGTGGYVAAIRAAQLGLKVAVVERQKALGGTCLIWGCIPTKALLEHAHALKVAQSAKEWGLTGVDGGKVGIDMPAVHARKDKIVTGLTGGIEMLFKKNKIDWIKGTARLTGGKGVEVTLRGRRHPDPHRHQGARRRHRVGAALGAGHRAGQEADHLQRRGDPPAARAEVDRDHGQRRRRRRVRVDLQELRQRGHDHRAAAAAGARRGRGGVGRAGAHLQEARHQGAHRHEGDEREGDGHRRRPGDADGGRQDARQRPSRCCSWPPAAGRSPTASTPTRSA